MIFKELDQSDDIIIELVMKYAIKLYERRIPDIPELYSQPRIAQGADVRHYLGGKLTPGWSLDLTRNDPKT